jgi:hypothetical protein
MDRRAATVFASAAVWVFFRVATAFGLSLATSTALTIFFAFGSQTLSTSSHALWMHGPGVLALLLLTWLAVPGAGPMRNRERIAASVLAGLAVAIRPSNLVLAAPLWLLIVRREWYPWRSLAALILPGTTIGAALAGYNVVIFGRLSGAYPASSFSGDPLSGLLGLLFSPGRGLVLYFPITLVAVVAPLLATAVRRDPLLRAAAMGVIGTIVVVAPWINWWGGYSFGPRLLTETQPFLLLLAGATIERADRRGARLALAIISVAVLLPWSVAVQVAGTFSRGPGLWNALPESVDKVPARLWNWSDNPVGRAFRRQTGSQ